MTSKTDAIVNSFVGITDGASATNNLSFKEDPENWLRCQLEKFEADVREENVRMAIPGELVKKMHKHAYDEGAQADKKRIEEAVEELKLRGDLFYATGGIKALDAVLAIVRGE